MKSEFKMILKKSSAGCAGAALLLLGGCGGDKAPAAAAAKKPSPKSAAAASPQAAGSTNIPKSVFAADDSLRDPFFPNAKKSAAQPGTPAAVALDIPALLQAELVGIGGAGDERVAVFRSALVEPGQTATVSVNAGGQQRGIQVRCREISRNSVTLEAQGFPRPITIAVPQAR